MFNINKAIKNSGLPRTEITKIQKEVKVDYPRDTMLYELHVIRALRAKGRAGNSMTVRRVA